MARTLRDGVVDIAHGIDAGSAIAHGRAVAPDHPARRPRAQPGKSPDAWRTWRSRS